MKTKKIDVRLDEDVYNIVTDIANQFDKTRSEVVRLALTNAIAKINNQRAYTKEEYNELIDTIKELSNAINKIETHLIRIGTNVNQLARYTHSIKDDRYITSNKQILLKHIEELNAMKMYLKDISSNVWERV